MKDLFKVLSLASLVVMICSSCSGEKKFELKKGDILFQDLDCGPLCDAIESVTQGVEGAKLSHVAVVSRVEGGKTYVLEAFTKGVSEVELDDFMSRSIDKKGNPKVLVGRVKMEQNMIEQDIQRALSLVGKKYDKVFDISDDSYYCSELLYEVFRDEKNKPVFELTAMTFKDPKTGNTMVSWSEYFGGMKKKIPEGGMGINPGLISRSDKVEIVYFYGCPDGWKKCKY